MIPMTRKTEVSLVLSVVVAVSAAATPLDGQTSSSHQRYRVEAVRVETGPALDGVLDDEVWQRATVVSEFFQQEPDEGAPASERTEVRLIYDERNIYIGVHAYSADPGAVVATEMRRDSDRILDEDNFQVIFDTFRDSRSGYIFVTNPLGAKLEQQIF
jgi:hypothetical protein